MPRKDSYNKKKVLQKIKEKRFYQSLIRDYNKQILDDLFTLVNEDSNLTENKYNLEFLSKELNKAYTEYLENPKNKQSLIRLSSISSLIWNCLEILE